jgi:uncharacterized protein (DUF427 family)
MPDGGNKSPGFAKRPDYRIDLAQERLRVRVTFNGEIVADSRRAVTLREGHYEPVYYLPREDVRMDRLERTSHASHCPYKGDASYWSVRVGGRVAENAVWSYERPYDEMRGIEGLVAFWKGRVDAIEAEPG